MRTLYIFLCTCMFGIVCAADYSKEPYMSTLVKQAGEVLLIDPVRINGSIVDYESRSVTLGKRVIRQIHGLQGISGRCLALYVGLCWAQGNMANICNMRAYLSKEKEWEKVLGWKRLQHMSAEDMQALLKRELKGGFDLSIIADLAHLESMIRSYPEFLDGADLQTYKNVQKFITKKREQIVILTASDLLVVLRSGNDAVEMIVYDPSGRDVKDDPLLDRLLYVFSR